jgi:hypothetical protein
MDLPKNRWRAFTSHFGISLLIFIVLLLLIVLFWFPGALFLAAGGWQGVRIIIGVDLVLGPLLTLIVYDPRKGRRVLCRDLAVIALIQLSCLAAGVYIVFAGRPVAVTYAHDTFYVLTRGDLVGFGADLPSLDLHPMTPKIFYTDLSRLAAATNIDVKTIGELYKMLDKKLASRTDLYASFPTTGPEAEAIFGNNPQPRFPGHRAGCVSVEMITAHERGIVCYDVERQRFAGFSRVEPAPE